MSFSSDYFSKVERIAASVDSAKVEAMSAELVALRERGGRLFLLGVGGSAANASHAVNDFRKLAKIECYCPTDNVSELTARTNDEGFETVFSAWLEISRLNEKDALFIFSVGGGNKERNVSLGLIKAIDLALERGSRILGIVGRADGYAQQKGHEVIQVPIVDDKLITPLSEAYQAVIWHALVSHPDVQQMSTKW